MSPFCRDVKQNWHEEKHGLATDSLLVIQTGWISGCFKDKPFLLTSKQLETAWPVLGPWLAKFWDYHASLGAIVTFCTSQLIGPACRDHAGFQAEMSKVSPFWRFPSAESHQTPKEAAMHCLTILKSFCFISRKLKLEAFKSCPLPGSGYPHVHVR